MAALNFLSTKRISTITAGVAPIVYLEELTAYCDSNPSSVASLLVFGSYVTGSFSKEVADIDMILVLHDTVTKSRHKQIRKQIKALEVKYGFSQSADSLFEKLKQY